MNSNTKWIWKNGENAENTWMNFVKTITLDIAPTRAVAKIAVDSKYWLYINGEPAVFEGGVKRGPSKHATYYDEIDITKYLTAGENTIAVLVWYFGDNGFSHLSSGMGGLLLEADIDDMIVSSDNTWRVIKNPAYVEADKNDFKSNFRLSESNIYYDAAKALDAWYAPGYDTSVWSNADVVGDAGKGAWGELCERMIPQLKDHGLKDYLNSSDHEGFTAAEDTILEMCMPYNAQITPYL
ncbi:MAG: alpha-L-rhamnosidase N-terminal domain-containing protein, partial [Clostridia bacterium]|nr:alpha-L-rhamnosidase N-terminal domain-containing protein [Clostridia bacterium]